MLVKMGRMRSFGLGFVKMSRMRSFGLGLHVYPQATNKEYSPMSMKSAAASISDRSRSSTST